MARTREEKGPPEAGYRFLIFAVAAGRVARRENDPVGIKLDAEHLAHGQELSLIHI